MEGKSIKFRIPGMMECVYIRQVRNPSCHNQFVNLMNVLILHKEYYWSSICSCDQLDIRLRLDVF